MIFHEFQVSIRNACAPNRRERTAFTLVEMLVAMAVTLLMMAALARAFGFIGEQVRDSRSALQMSSEIRDVTTRLENELKRCTVRLEPNLGDPDQPGYFLYHEGPLTDVTSSIFRATVDDDGNLSLPDSRYGDFDDYIAFTAVAPPNSWFVGKVPRYLLDAKTAEVQGTSINYQDDDHFRFDPVVIKSKYAEIIYFANPDYDDSVPVIDPTFPKYVDVDGDVDLDGDGDEFNNGLPDRLRIYRRVLLIRPDLNVDPALLTVSGTSDLIINAADPPHLPRLPHDHDDLPGTPVKQFMQTDVYPNNWRVAMAAAHQQCDLSIRRVLDPVTGLPTNRVAANSLADLSKPHNRFAHVRIPRADLGVGVGNDTSMPVLALGRPVTILNMSNENGDRIAPRLGPMIDSNDPVVTPNDYCGFVRPEFVLGRDRIHTDPEDPAWSLSARLGEDLLVSGVLAFDVQIYDRTAASITDAASGLVVSPNDAGYRGALNGLDIDLKTPPVDPVVASRVSRGAFVDLAYPVLAGGSLRGWNACSVDRRSTADNDSSQISNVNRDFLISEFSGVQATTTSVDDSYRSSLYHSGHLVVLGANRILLFQPTFDTYTSFYQRDGYLQFNRPSGGLFTGTIWRDVTAGADLGANGIDDGGWPGADDRGEQETFPPMDVRPDAIRVTVRLESSSTQQVQQATVVHRDNQ